MNFTSTNRVQFPQATERLICAAHEKLRRRRAKTPGPQLSAESSDQLGEQVLSEIQMLFKAKPNPNKPGA